MPHPRRLTAAGAAVVALSGVGALLTAAPPASAASGCSSPVFTRQFFANTSFSGKPKKKDCDSAVNENWGSRAPAKGLPRDRFGVRWTLTRDFGSGGPFALTASGLDGIRVYVDGKRRVNLWNNTSSSRTRKVDVTIAKGRHTLRIDYVNWTGSAKVKVSYAPRTSASADKVEPLVPAGAKAVYDAGTRKAKVSWSKNKEMDLAGYRVLRRLKGSSSWTRLTTTTKTSHTDTPPPTGQTYYYEVRAVDKAGNVSAGTADKPVTTIDRTPPAAPAVTVRGCGDGRPYAAVEVTPAVADSDDVVRHQVQRQDRATGAWTTVHDSGSAFLCDTGQPIGEGTVVYRARVLERAGNWSAWTTVTARLSDVAPPAAPAVRLRHDNGVPHLTWSPVPGAVAYRVTERTPHGGWADALPGGEGTTTLTDVVPRRTGPLADSYRYAVHAVDARGNVSAPAEVVLDLGGRPAAIAPYAVSARPYDWPTARGVQVWWRIADPWSYDGAVRPRIRVERTDLETGETVLVDRCQPNVSTAEPGPPTLSWGGADDAPAYVAAGQVLHGQCRDGGVEPGARYAYRVTVVDRQDRSATGPVAVATAPGTRIPGPVTGLTAEPLEYGVRLAWQPSGAPATAHYDVYVREEGDAEPRSLTRLDASRTTVTHLRPAEGGAPRYFVVAVDADGNSLLGPAGSGSADWSAPVASVRVTAPDLRPSSFPEVTAPDCDLLTSTTAEGPKVTVWCPYSPTTGWNAKAHFHRWDPAAGAWVRLTSEPQGLSWTDTAAPAGTTVFYAAAFVGKDGAERFAGTAAVATRPAG